MELGSMLLVFWMLSFKPAFPLSSFTFIKRHFSFSSHSAVRVISSAYLKLLIFLLAVLIPACGLSSLAFRMMYSACKLNKCVAILILKMEEKRATFSACYSFTTLRKVKIHLKHNKRFMQCMEKVLWLIEHVKSGLWSFMLRFLVWWCFTVG